jgi:toxin ParE1/3/4
MPEERIEKTVLATQDIEQLAAYYQVEAGIAVALRFVNNAEHAFVQLAQMPRMGAFLGFLRAPHAGIRRWHIKGFPRLLILYRDMPDGIEVIRVLDAGRDINALFDDADFPST